MSLQRAYHHLSEEKRAAIMALAREGFSGAHIARRCGISEATVSKEFSRQFPQGIPLKERRKRYEASAAHTRYRENRKKSKPRGKLLPQVIKTAEKLILQGYSPEQMANTVLKGQASTVSIYRWLYAGFLLYGDRSLLRHKGRRHVQRKEGKAKKNTAGRSVHTRPDSIESRSVSSDRSMDPLNDRLLDPPHQPLEGLVRWVCDEPASLTPESVLTGTKERREKLLSSFRAKGSMES